MASGARQAAASLSGGDADSRAGAMTSRLVRDVGLLALVCCAALGACKSEAQRHDEGSGASSPAAGSTVLLTPRALAVAGIQTESATVATVPETFATTGEIEFDPSRVVALN